MQRMCVRACACIDLYISQGPGMTCLQAYAVLTPLFTAFQLLLSIWVY